MCLLDAMNIFTAGKISERSKNVNRHFHLYRLQVFSSSYVPQFNCTFTGMSINNLLCFSQLTHFLMHSNSKEVWLIVLRDGAMLEINYFMRLLHMMKADGMLAKCGWSHQRFAFQSLFFCWSRQYKQKCSSKKKMIQTKVTHESTHYKVTTSFHSSCHSWNLEVEISVPYTFQDM